MREKRQHQRAVLKTPVTVVTKEGETWSAESIDISVGGMFLGSTPHAKIGAEVELQFELGKLGFVKLPGFIRWTAERGFGVQFGLLGPRETHAIGGLVSVSKS